MMLLESMALGCAVVASRVGGIPEVLEDMVSGRLVSPQDEHALGDAIKEVASSRNLRDKLGKAARERIIRDYDAKNIASQIRELYWHSRANSLR